MNYIIQPTEDIEKLQENIETRLQKETKIENQRIIILDLPENQQKKLNKIPGIQKYRKTNEEEWQPGLKGKPIQEQAYAKLENKRDAVKALIATQEGYNLVILRTDKDWDLRQLKKYNPSIKQLKHKKPPKQLDIQKTITPLEDKEKVEIEMPNEEQEIEIIYQKMLT